MTNIILTHTRTDPSKIWVMVSPETTRKTQIFSPDEILVLSDSLEDIKNLPGYFGSSIEIPDDYTYKIVMSFDSAENAIAAKDMLTNPAIDSLIYKRQQILKTKRLEFGVEYNVILEVV